MPRSRSCCCRRKSRSCSWARNGRARGRFCSSAISSRSWPRRCARDAGANSRNSPSSGRGGGADRIPDPTAETSFAASRLDWAERDREPHARWLERYRRLLALRARAIVPRLAGMAAGPAVIGCSGRRRCASSGGSATAHGCCSRQFRRCRGAARRAAGGRRPLIYCSAAKRRRPFPAACAASSSASRRERRAR